MNRFNYILILLIATFTPEVSFATPGMTSEFAINSVYARGVGYEFDGDTTSNPMGCSVSGSFRINTDTTNFELLTANILTAYASGKDVLVWVSGCDSDGFSIVTGVRIR